jgi:phage minor structural protein
LVYIKPQFIVQDPNESVLGATSGYYDSNLTWSLSTNFAILTFSLPANDAASGVMKNNNYLTFVYQNRTWRFQIVTVEVGDDGNFTVTANALALQLINGQLDATGAPTDPQPAKYYVGQALANTGWTVGRDEIGNSEVKKVSFSDATTPIARLYSIADAFGVELDFRTELDNHYNLTGKYVDIVSALGTERNDIMLGWGENVTSIGRTIDTSSLVTALIATGASGINLTSLDYTSSDGRFKSPAGVSYLMDTVANQKLNNGAGYIIGTYSDDGATSQQQLLTDTIAQLKTLSSPSVTFDTKLAYLPSDVMIGDTLYLISNDPNNIVRDTTRVVELDICLDDPSKTSAKFGDYKTLDTDTSLADIVQLKKQVSQAQATANSAQTTANSAQSTASQAAQTAATAQSTANSAQTVANTANTTAATAKATANQAQTMLPIISTTAPANPQEGQIWFEGDSSTNVKSIHKYVSGSWQTNDLLPTSMNVTQLSALSADLGTINAGTLNAVNLNSANIHNHTSSPDTSADLYVNENGLLLSAQQKLHGTTSIVSWTWLNDYGQVIAGYSLTDDFNQDFPLVGSVVSVRLDPISAGLFFTSSQLGGGFYLDIQDAYQDSTRTVVWSSGWGTWGSGHGDIVLIRHGRLVTLFGYPKNTGSNYGHGAQIAQLPDWAKPIPVAGGINIYAVSFNSGVGNMQPCPVFLNTNGAITLASGAQQNGYVRIFPLTYPAKDM